MSFILSESPSIMSIPRNIQKTKNNNLRANCIIQTIDEVNNNLRRYTRPVMETGLSKIKPRITEGAFVGELDHPITKNPNRQFTVLYKCASHRILECGWDGNKLVAVVETLRTPNGRIMRNLAEDGIPIGFSFRGMGELRTIFEGGRNINEVVEPFHIVTWDCVSNPSHSTAKIMKITENVQSQILENTCTICEQSKFIHESHGVKEVSGVVCTSEGVCYLPNDFDELVDKHIINLVKKYL